MPGKLTDEGDRVVLVSECPCGQLFEMTAHDMGEVSGVARWCYLERMRRAAGRAIIRHCSLGRATLN